MKRKRFTAALAALLAVAMTVPAMASSYPAIGSKPDESPWRPVDHGIKSIYPLKGNNKVTYWCDITSNVTGNASNLNDIPWGKTLEKMTGIKVEYQHPASGQAQSQFNLMTAANDLADIVEGQWNRWYQGGGEAALNDKLIINLSVELGKGQNGSLPYFSAYLKDNPIIDKQVKTDSGAYYIFPFVRATESLKTTSGPIVRKDWLDDLKLEVPVTITDWDNVLTQFKDKKGATAALSQYTDSGSPANGLMHQFSGAFGFRQNYYVDTDGVTIKYGQYTEQYKDFLTLMNKWYKEGILDKDFATMTNRNDLTAKVLQGKTGSAYGRGGGDIGDWLTQQDAKGDKTFNVVAANWPVQNRGDKKQYSGSDNFYVDNSTGNAAISFKSKNYKLAMQLLDYAYSPEGHVTYNFGEEGVSYSVKDGKEIYSDAILKPKADAIVKGKTLTVAQGMSWFARGNWNGPFIQDPGYLEQFWSTWPQQQDAMKKWTNLDDANKTLLPVLNHTSEEIKVESKLRGDITTYVNEMAVKFITGAEPLSKYDDYIKTLKRMNIEQMINIKQDAYDRYLAK